MMKIVTYLCMVLFCSFWNQSVSADASTESHGFTNSTEYQELIERFDTDNDMKLSQDEAKVLFNEVLNDEALRLACNDTKQFMNAADNQLMDIETELPDYMFSVFFCGLYATTSASASIEFEGIEYSCSDVTYLEHLESEKGHEDEHDDHDHLRSRRAEEDEHEEGHDDHNNHEEDAIDIKVGLRTFHCEPKEEHEEETVNITLGVWLEAIGATLVICAMSLIGILILLPCFKGLSTSGIVMKYYVPACTSGALFSAIMMHILPELVEMVGSFNLFLSITISGGFMAGMILELFCDGGHMHGHSHQNHGHSASESHEHVGGEQKDTDLNKLQREYDELLKKFQNISDNSKDGNKKTIVTGEIEMESMSETTKGETDSSIGVHHGHSHETRNPTYENKKQQLGLRSLVILGDAMHNIVDGVIVGIAFATCGSTTGWIVTASVILHELPQELADFLILLSTGLSTFHALLFNLASACTALLGTIFSLIVAGQIDEANMGYFLGVGVGILLYISAGDLVPTFVHYESKELTTSNKLFAVSLHIVAFAIVGVLSKAFDAHCGGHEGHDDH